MAGAYLIDPGSQTIMDADCETRDDIARLLFSKQFESRRINRTDIAHYVSNLPVWPRQRCFTIGDDPVPFVGCVLITGPGAGSRFDHASSAPSITFDELVETIEFQATGALIAS